MMNHKIGTCRRICVDGRPLFAKGSREPCWMVKTLIVAVVPWTNRLGAAEQVLIGAFVEQLKTTLKEKPFTSVKLTAFL